LISKDKEFSGSPRLFSPDWGEASFNAEGAINHSVSYRLPKEKSIKKEILTKLN
jgi:hypothetical protein